MTIQYFGLSCFRLKGSEKTILINPYVKSAEGLLPKMPADILIFTGNGQSESIQRIVGQPFVISRPGEYEIGGISVFCWQMKNKEETVQPLKMVNLITVDSFWICYLDPHLSPLSEAMVEEIDGVDALILPVGTDPEQAKQAITLAEKIEPKIIVPFDFEGSGLLERWGREPIKLDKLNLKTFAATEETQLVLLTNSRE